MCICRCMCSCPCVCTYLSAFVFSSPYYYTHFGLPIRYILPVFSLLCCSAVSSKMHFWHLRLCSYISSYKSTLSICSIYYICSLSLALHPPYLRFLPFSLVWIACFSCACIFFRLLLDFFRVGILRFAVNDSNFTLALSLTLAIPLSPSISLSLLADKADCDFSIVKLARTCFFPDSWCVCVVSFRLLHTYLFPSFHSPLLLYPTSTYFHYGLCMGSRTINDFHIFPIGPRICRFGSVPCGFAWQWPNVFQHVRTCSMTLGVQRSWVFNEVECSMKGEKGT